MVFILLSATVDATTPTFGSPVQVYETQSNFGEPSIKVAPNGHVFIVTVSDETSLPFRALRSSNNGSSWADVSPATDATLVVASDVDIAIDPCGNLYVALGTYSQGSVRVYNSDDEGDDWTLSAILIPGAGGLADRPWLVAGACGWVYVSVLVYSGVGNKIEFWWLDGSTGDWHGGDTFGIADARPGSIAYSSGTLYAIYRSPVAPAGHLAVARSTDNGDSFTAFSVTSADTGELADFPVITNDGAGNLYAIWSPTGGNVFYSYSTNSASTWSTALAVSPSGGSNAFPWGVGGAAGKLDIVWYRALDGNADPNNNDGPWYVYFAQSLSANTTSPAFITAQATSASIHNDVICTKGAGCSTLPPKNREMGDLFQVARNETGWANIAFMKTTDANGDDTDEAFVFFVNQNGGDPI